MIAADFDYVAPATLDEALAALANGDGDAKPLAGGHSLLPLMKLRFAAPSLLVDLRQLSELRGLDRDGDSWRIGALTRHAELQARPELGAMAEAAALIADQQVRNRGTLGGSLAHADSASDLPTVLLATDGSVTVRGAGGDREIPAADLFLDYLTTAIAPDEILTGVRLPALEGWGHAYEKFARRAGDWAMAGACALVDRAEDGSCRDVRVALTNMAPTPIRAAGVEAALRGVPLTPEAIEAAAEQAGEGTSPPGDLNATPDYKRHLARVLTRRALTRAVSSSA